ncbi:MAG TPA: sugar transferase [Candidatus Marinimicrobia bacterium]|nr:sugar transferase [Candidatus Neomarinimicrobiota bacterium]
MLKEQANLFRILSRISDFVLIILSIILAVQSERLYHQKGIDFFDFRSFHPYLVPVVILIWEFLFKRFEKGFLFRRHSYFSFLKSTFLISIIGFLVLISISFLAKQFLFHRLTIIFFAVVSFVLLLAKRWGLKYYLERIRKKGRNTRYIIIVGSKERAKRLIEEFNHNREYGYIVQSVFDLDSERIGEVIGGFTVKSFSEFDETISSNPVDEVFFAMPLGDIPNVYDKINLLNMIGINFHMMVNLNVFTSKIKNLRIEPFIDDWYGLPVISFLPTDKKLVRLLMKTYVETILSFILLVIFSPFLLVISIWIKLDSRGPILFGQTRIGYHGRRFKLYKFRTMHEDAENRLEELTHLNEQSGPIFKITDDPRITRAGRFLRRFSFDECPQWLNVLIGDMNLVGPRPPLPSEVINYKPEWRRRLNMKPGITGLWQVSGRNELKEFEDWIKLDFEYIDDWSLWLDIKIIFKTIPVILFGTGK